MIGSDCFAADHVILLLSIWRDTVGGWCFTIKTHKKELLRSGKRQLIKSIIFLRQRSDIRIDDFEFESTLSAKQPYSIFHNSFICSLFLFLSCLCFVCRNALKVIYVQNTRLFSSP